MKMKTEWYLTLYQSTLPEQNDLIKHLHNVQWYSETSYQTYVNLSPEL
jgi:hypothetical protein